MPRDLQRERAQDFWLWQEHRVAWEVYQRCARQWRMAAGLAHVVWLGLDYQGVEIVMRNHGVDAEQWPDVFWQVQMLEDEEARLRNEQL